MHWLSTGNLFQNLNPGIAGQLWTLFLYHTWAIFLTKDRLKRLPKGGLLVVLTRFELWWGPVWPDGYIICSIFGYTSPGQPWQPKPHRSLSTFRFSRRTSSSSWRAWTSPWCRWHRWPTIDASTPSRSPSCTARSSTSIGRSSQKRLISSTVIRQSVTPFW